MADNRKYTDENLETAPRVDDGAIIDGTTGELEKPPKIERIDNPSDLMPIDKADERKGRRRIDLSTLRDVRIEIAYVYRAIADKKLSSQDGSRRTYILRQIADVIALAELEKRVEQLEESRNATIAGQRALPAQTMN